MATNDEIMQLIDDITDEAIQKYHPEMITALKLHIAALEHIIYDCVTTICSDQLLEPERKIYLAIVTPDPPTPPDAH